MVHIESFVEVGHLLVPVAQYTGRAELGYPMVGAMELSIDGKPIFTRIERDWIDVFWGAFARNCESVLRGETIDRAFPDAAAYYSIAPEGRRIRIKCWYPGVDRVGVADRRELVGEILRAGRVFWHRIRAAGNERGADAALATLERLESALAALG